MRTIGFSAGTVLITVEPAMADVFNLAKDPGEKENLAELNPDIAAPRCWPRSRRDDTLGVKER